jgi:hypothetical protein
MKIDGLCKQFAECGTIAGYSESFVVNGTESGARYKVIVKQVENHNRHDKATTEQFLKSTIQKLRSGQNGYA